MPDRSGVEQHHDVEVDAVHPVRRRVGAPGAVGAHRGDLHADTENAPVDREGEGSDPVAVTVVVPAAPSSAPRTCARHVSHVRHPSAVPTSIVRPVSHFHHRLAHLDLPPKKSDFYC
ncbi:hypothetical protein GCM10017779_55540 [Streptomyces capillispiralis]|nr:hypothetical protein GCM10017779_55540 [Streptomyces capillispiralis]